VKYEYVYLQDIETVNEARAGFKQYFQFYNKEYQQVKNAYQHFLKD